MHTRESNALAAWTVLATDAMEAAQLEVADLPERSLAALILLRNRPESNVDWLFRRLGITQSGAVRLVDRLVTLGLVRREKAPGRKEVALHVTASGEARLQQGLTARATAVQTLVESLSTAEQTQLAALVGKALAGGTRRRKEADIACRLCDWDACKPVCPLDASVVQAGSL
jgi:DNA-binding MarR family transcriptional regulator